MNTQASITFFGDERFSHSSYNQAPIFEFLARQKLISALVIKKNPTLSRLQRKPVVFKIAKRHGIPVCVVQTINDLHDLQLPSSNLGLVASFGLIMPKAFCQAFNGRIFNLHPSLLPRHRGVSPVETALLKGDPTTGMTLALLSEEIDAGPIVDQKSMVIDEQIPKLELTKQLGQLGQQLIADNLPSLLTTKPTDWIEQDETLATYTPKIKPLIVKNFLSQSANYWQRYIRAYQECPNNRFVVIEKICRLLEVDVAKDHLKDAIYYDKKNTSLNVRCRKDHLSIRLLQPANGRIMNASSFINGFGRNIPKR